MTSKKSTVWETLSKINCSKYTEKKGDLTYLSWAHAYQILKDNYPGATFHKHWFDYGGPSNETVPAHKLPYAMDKNGNCFVQVTVTVEGVEATEVMPVLDHRNRPVQKPDSFQINTSLQRTLAKACAFHGLGMHIYRGEDLIEETEEETVVHLVDQPEEVDKPEEVEAETEEKPVEKKTPLKSLGDWRKAFRDHPDHVVDDQDGSIVFGEAKNESGWKMIRQIVAVFMPRIGDKRGDKVAYDTPEKCVKAIETFYKVNRKTITLLSKAYPAIHKDVMALFKAAKGAAKSGEEFPLHD